MQFAKAKWLAMNENHYKEEHAAGYWAQTECISPGKIQTHK